MNATSPTCFSRLCSAKVAFFSPISEGRKKASRNLVTTVGGTENSKMPDKITKERLAKEFKVTGSALEMAKAKRVLQKDGEGKPDQKLENAAYEFLDMAERYFDDAKHFSEKGDVATAFGCLNYAHGWLDAGARLGLWNVKGRSDLFVVD